MIPRYFTPCFRASFGTRCGRTLQFEERVIWDQGEYIYGIAAADLDGDGDLDLTSSDAVTHVLYWYENDGHGHAVDLDADGDMDVTMAYGMHKQ